MCCYGKIIHFGFVTATPFNIRLHHHPSLDYFPIRACPMIFYSLHFNILTCHWPLYMLHCGNINDNLCASTFCRNTQLDWKVMFWTSFLISDYSPCDYLLLFIYRFPVLDNNITISLIIISNFLVLCYRDAKLTFKVRKCTVSIQQSVNL